MRLLRLLRRHDLGDVAPAWRGWGVISAGPSRGALASPEGELYTPGDVRASRLEHTVARELRAQLDAATAAALSDAEKMARVAALAALKNAQRAAAAALEELTEDLSDAERGALFERLDATAAARRRNERESSVGIPLTANEPARAD